MIRNFKAMLTKKGLINRPSLIRNALRYSLIGVITCLISIFSSAQGQNLMAGAATVDITPKENGKFLNGYQPRQSVGVLDPIFHRIVVLNDGKTELVLISSDLTLMSPALADEIEEQIGKKLNLKPENIWWMVTHTHSAPEVGSPGLINAFLPDRYVHLIDTAYTRKVGADLADGIVKARNRMARATLGVGWGFSQANINRRAIDIHGNSTTGLNPDGPVDRRIGLIRIDRKDNGLPIAVIANYPMHATVLGPKSQLVSGDATGVVSRYVEEKLGIPMLYMNGAAGDIAPIYSVYATPEDLNMGGHLNQFKLLLGDKILNAFNGIRSSMENITLLTGSVTVQTPKKSGLAWPTELKNYAMASGGETKAIKLPVRFLKINNEVAIWSAPVELFTEIAMKVREKSPFPYTFFFGYANGWLGYLPTEEAFHQGTGMLNYEVNYVSPFTSSVEKDLTDAVLSYLQGELWAKKK